MKNLIFNFFKWLLSIIGLFLIFLGITFIVNGEYSIEYIISLVVGIFLSYFFIRKLFKTYKSDLILLKAGLTFLGISLFSYLILHYPFFEYKDALMNAVVLQKWYISFFAIVAYSFVRIGILFIIIFLIKRIFSYFKRR